MLVTILATIFGLVAGWVGGRAEHFEIYRRLINCEAFLRGINAREAKKANKDTPLQVIDPWADARARAGIPTAIP